VLNAAELDQFVEAGYVHLRSAFPRALATRCREIAAAQLDIDLTDPTSWREPVVRGLVYADPLREAANASRLLDAIGQLLDHDDWSARSNLGLVVVRFPSESDPGDTGWHIDSSFEAHDGRWFVNFRSRERGLLLLCLLSDVDEHNAPTRIRPGTHLEMPPLLAPFGEDGSFGLEVPLPEPTGVVTLATGEAGDVYICHPFLVHAASWPHRGNEPRFVAQPPISIKGNVRTEGDFDGLSPVARAIRAALDRR
jgi:hypothetical protein